MSPIETEPGPDISPESNEGVAIRRFIALTREERELKARLQEVASMKGALELSIRDYLMSTGLHSVNADGFNVYIREMLWAKAKSTSSGPEVCAALKAAGMSQFVREHFEVQALSAHIRGLKHAYAGELASGAIKDISQVLPPEVARVLNVEPTYSVIAMRGRE